MIKWRDQKIEVRKCGIAITKANSQGIVIPDEFYKKMTDNFSTDEIEAIETYVTYKTFCGPPESRLADYMTSEQMNEKIEMIKIAGGN